ncbi:MAG: cytochrome c biogenesis protein CcsA [Kofleriaceae bacterium]|nr:cytochrome c biogenesis protein CcsA [Kofleriaceae bacterium]
MTPALAVAALGGAAAEAGTRQMSIAPTPAFWLAVIGYVVAAAALLGVLSGRTGWSRGARVILLVAFLAHAGDIALRGVGQVHPAQSVREAIGFLAWILCGGYLAASVRYRLTVAGVVITPVVLCLLLAARLTPVGESTAELTALGRVHIVLATVGVGIFALASALAAIYLLEARSLKRKQFDLASLRIDHAPLEPLDRMAHHLVWTGFPIFTAAMVLGVVWMARRGDALGRPEHVLALVCWAVFAALLAARTFVGWRGRRSARLTLAGFAVALVVLGIYLLRRVVGL